MGFKYQTVKIIADINLTQQLRTNRSENITCIYFRILYVDQLDIPELQCIFRLNSNVCNHKITSFDKLSIMIRWECMLTLSMDPLFIKPYCKYYHLVFYLISLFLIFLKSYEYCLITKLFFVCFTLSSFQDIFCHWRVLFNVVLHMKSLILLSDFQYLQTSEWLWWKPN